VLANFLIGLREGLEAGLIVAILAAYVVKIGRRDVLGRLWVGVGIAVAVSLGVGALLTWGPYALSDEGGELLGGILSLVAVAMVTWMIFWMGTHGASLSGELRGRVDAAIDRSWIAIVVLGAVSVGREGIETALFVWANVSSGSDPVQGTLGALLGILVAVALVWGISRGLVRINLSRFFTWTGVFLILVAAGVFAYAIHELQEVGVIPEFGGPAWDLSAVLSRDTWLGALLAGIFNFTPAPTWAQVIGWVAYVVVTLTLYLRLLHRRHTSTPAAAAPAATAPAEVPADAAPSRRESVAPSVRSA
jgi:high-affinity iron transporter